MTWQLQEINNDYAELQLSIANLFFQ